ncbi:hypothetical protein [Fusibacter ferrireducens]|uniref:Alcohol acetyltransferase n=1 Tax=Fusibacter ferrireducens TaxID=2785058 RepID=A0ABR9ZMZ6_9FIRM|nr:hypothetical protein [Fusibacter ferrireducens]MBF4691843.1 hypothetical protein [Fusibacter ferrireducens]
MKKQRQDNWFKLDNAGKLYPSIASSRVSTVFRLTAVLKMPVKADLLQQALGQSVHRFPLFNVKLRRGIFWYYFEKTTEPPRVHRERYFPCTSTDLRYNQPSPYKILYFKNRVHLEISHAIADGAGGLIFLKDILKNYHALLDESCNPIAETPISKEVLATLEEDAFKKNYEKKIPSPQKLEKAYHFPFKLIEKGEYRITNGTYSASAFKALAKTYNTSPTKMLLCLYFETIQDFIRENETVRLKDLKPLIINLPVDLRSIFPSKTMRNFFISITPSIDLRLGEYNRSEILTYLDHYFALCLTPKYLKRYISRNFKNELFWHVRLIPLFIKDLAMPFIYNYYGESSYTSSLSNLGVIKIDEPYAEIIEKLELLPPPSEGNIIKATVITFNDITTISFGSLTDERVIERLFFRKLRNEGISIKIETNY